MFHVRFISLLSLITIHQVWTYESFNDFPLTIDDGDYMIYATLNDLISGKKYFLKEYIHSSSNSIRGKITLNLDTSSSMDIHYSLNEKNQRLVIKDYDCTTFNYKTDWDKKIPGITDPLLNHILLVGPSIIYRLEHRSLAWFTGDDTEIRGIIRKSAYTTIGYEELDVTVYYKDTFTSYIDLSKPSRLKFIGYEKSNGRTLVKHNSVLDYYVLTRTDEELDKLIIPKPGIGCPTYFSIDAYGKSYHTLVENSVHYISIENVNEATHSKTVNEMNADEVNQISSLRTTSQGITTEAIYDYILGLVYVRQSNGLCSTSQIGFNTQGVSGDDLHRPFKINHLIDFGFNYKYLGETWLDGQLGRRTDVWESIVFDEKISTGQRYDKVVATIYTVDPKNEDTESGMIPVSVTIHAYNKSSKGSYSLMEVVRKDYHNFRQKIENDDLINRFRIDDCYPNQGDRKTLAIQFDCENEDCEYAVRKHNFAIKDQLRQKIHDIGTISSTRIGNLEIVLDTNSIIAYVQFLNFIDLSEAFVSTQMYLAPTKYGTQTKSDNAISCLKQKAVSYTTYEAVVYCNGEKLCFSISKFDDLIEDKENGKDCTIYQIPLRNLYRYNLETPLDNIQNVLKGKGLSLFFNTGRSMIQYKASRVDEIVELESESRQLFRIGNLESKLVQDGTKNVVATSAPNLGACYRACVNLENNDCETFSYCQWSDKTECLLSSLVYANTTDGQVTDSSCKIYRKNRLQDYIKIENREFIDQISVSVVHSVDDCADLCSQSGECFSFQVSRGTCQFGGYYTDSKTKYSRDSAIYMPKLAQKYARTGNKIVTETFHTELSLTLDQCAALCYDMESSDGQCLSYNFCPKGKTASSCSLSNYSAENSSTTTSDSNVCTNYELIPEKSNNNNNQKQNSDASMVNGTNGLGTFGIIVSFIGVGLILGLAGPFVYNKAKSFVTTSSQLNDIDNLMYNNL